MVKVGVLASRAKLINNSLLLAGVAAGSFVCSAPTAAQESAQAAVDDVGNSEILVTARKREERLQDVPVSASVITGETILQRGLSDIKDLLTTTPNVSFPDLIGANYNTNIVIRGVSTSTRNIGFESGVGVYVDGVYVGRPLAVNQQLVGIGSVEILRGPQGTLFGKNNNAGAVNIATVQPDASETKVGAMLQYARFDNFYGNAYLNLPLGADNALRVSGFYHSSDGYLKDVVSGDRYATDGSVGARAQLQLNPSDNVQVTLAADFQRDDFLTAFPETIVDGGIPGFAPVRPGPYTTSMTFPPFEERDIWGTSLTVEYGLPNDFSITSITAYRDNEVFDSTDNDNDPADRVSQDFGEKEEHFTQEIRLTSPGDQRLDYVLGVWYLDQTTKARKQGFINPPNNILVRGLIDTKSYALFGDAQFDLTDDLTLGFGLRYNYEKKKLKGFSQVTSPALAGVFRPFAAVNGSRSNDNWSPQATMSYKFSDQATGYLKYSVGYKGGGWNVDYTTAPEAPLSSADPVEFDDEKLTNYEAGLKGSLFDRRVTFNSAVFYMDYQNQQVQQREGVRFLVRNAGTSELYGVEFDVTASLTDSLTVSGGAGYVHAKYKRFDACNAALASCAGNRLADAPKWTGSLAIDWKKAFPKIGLVSAHFDIDYRGNNYTGSAVNDPRLLTPKYTNANVNVGFGPEDERWRVIFFVNNVFERLNTLTRYLDTLGDPTSVNAVYAPPRSAGVRLNLQL